MRGVQRVEVTNVSWGEVHVFRERVFVTRGRFTTGVAVEGDASGARLGEAILRLYALDSDSYRDERASWRAFCENVVSPPTGGWIFVVNAVRGFDGSSVASLSARLGTEVQYFGNHRVSDYAEWALAVDGQLVRHVCCGETSEWCEVTGTPTPVEIALGFAALKPDELAPDQYDVMRVAAAWSIDPNALCVIESSPRPGLLGHLT
ncbi:hypothetical protein [Actinoplanes regularis]|uniref:hypothetical protein n=1 Tax=Actinoplanes regularis TaxID=52697 RepID=UPI0024A02269|nr:hypothetical protein [Actinoplanes regularis]GLW35889.1 hypothetical protein Areg01_88240 [Actinoplanes regularis]